MLCVQSCDALPTACMVSKGAGYLLESGDETKMYMHPHSCCTSTLCWDLAHQMHHVQSNLDQSKQVGWHWTAQGSAAH